VKKLTRKEIAEGLKSVPIERILLGATPSNLRLTKKQKTFAEEVVKTGNKTEAYRRAYDTQGSRKTQGRDAIKVSSNPNVSTYINALECAKEAEEYLLPQRLRTMAIHKLSNMALNDDLPPAQQLKALELIGKMSEVSLFTHRAEVIHTVDSNSLRTKLMDAIQVAIQRSTSLHTKTKRSAEELLAEINAAEPIDVLYVEHDTDVVDVDTDGDVSADGETDTPRTPTTPFSTGTDQPDLHSIPHSEPTPIMNSSQSRNNISTDTHPLVFSGENREGGI
jgi:phage terminase small subunit